MSNQGTVNAGRTASRNGKIALPSVSSDGCINYRSIVENIARNVHGLSGDEKETVQEQLAALYDASIIDTLVVIFSHSNEQRAAFDRVLESPSSLINNLFQRSKQDSLTTSRALLTAMENSGDHYAIVLQDAHLERPNNATNMWGDIISGAREAGQGSPSRSLQGYPVTDTTRGSPSSNLKEDYETNTFLVPQYRLFQLSYVNSMNPVPVVDRHRSDVGLTYMTINRYPLGSIESQELKSAYPKLAPGTLVKVTPILGSNELTISEIISNDPIFTNLVVNSLIIRSSFLLQQSANNREQETEPLTATPPAGDEICDFECKSRRLHLAYKDLYTAEAANMIDPLEIYDKLNAVLQKPALALAILANARAESGFRANNLSFAGTTNPSQQQESSLGIWQFNVGSNGYVHVPNSSIQQRVQAHKKYFHPDTIIPSDAAVVPYFAGGLFLRNNSPDYLQKPNSPTGVTIIEPTIDPVYTWKLFDGTQDLSPSWAKATDWEKQTEFVIESVKMMVGSLDSPPDGVTVQQWTVWFQVYFEQPALNESKIRQRLQHIPPTRNLLIAEMERQGRSGDANVLRTTIGAGRI